MVGFSWCNNFGQLKTNRKNSPQPASRKTTVAPKELGKRIFDKYLLSGNESITQKFISVWSGGFEIQQAIVDLVIVLDAFIILPSWMLEF